MLSPGKCRNTTGWVYYHRVVSDVACGLLRLEDQDPRLSGSSPPAVDKGGAEPSDAGSTGFNAGTDTGIDTNATRDVDGVSNGSDGGGDGGGANSNGTNANADTGVDHQTAMNPTSCDGRCGVWCVLQS